MIILDLLAGIFYVVIIILLAMYIANRTFRNEAASKRTFMIALSIKLIAALLFGSLYQFYYGYGDSINYYQSAREFLSYVSVHPSSILDFVFLNQDILQNRYPDFLEKSMMVPEYFINSNILVQRFAFLLGPFAGYLYFPLCVLFAVISFVGCWKMYRVLAQLFPQYDMYAKISFLYLPSVVFWTAGIGKDALCIGFVNLFAALMIELFLLKKGGWLKFVAALFLLWMVYRIKTYIILAFVPFFALFLFTCLLRQIANRAKRFVAIAAFLMIGMLVGAYVLLGTNLLQSISNEILENAFYLTRGQQQIDFGNESRYDLGISMQDIQDKNIKPYILSAIEVGIFRPYIGEVSKPIMVLFFLESFFFLAFVVFIFIRGLIVKPVSIILKSNLLFFLIAYSVVFAFFVGLVSMNFGTLVRYKTPFVSYFLLGLFIVNHQLKERKTNASGNKIIRLIEE